MKDSISHLHQVCEDWRKELHFFRDEIRTLRGRLGDVVLKNHNKDILVQVEHYENKFRILETHVKELMHNVKSKDRLLVSQAAAAQAKPSRMRTAETDQTIEDLMLITSKDFYETKNEYQRFLASVF
jgi:hypothetical protein